VLVGVGEAATHGEHRRIGRPRRAEPEQAVDDLGVAVAALRRVQQEVRAEAPDVPSGLREQLLHPAPSLRRRGRQPVAEDEPVGRADGSPVRDLAEPAAPDRDAAAGAGHDVRPVEAVELAVEGDELLGEQQTQVGDLLVEAAPAALEGHAEGLVLGRVVAGGDPQPQPPARHEVDIGCLPGDEHGLALREDQDPGHQLDLPGRRGEEGEGRERVVERVPLGVGAPDLGERPVVCPDDVVVEDQVPVPELLRGDGEPAQGRRVTTELDLRADHADPHRAGAG
jgi:hypothetical protein